MKLEDKIKDKLNEILSPDCYQRYELQLDKVAAKLSLPLYNAEFKDPHMSGAIYKDEETGNFNIYTKGNYSLERKRFIFAHYIGHYISALCDSHSKKQLFESEEGFEDYAVSYRKNEITDLIEIEANQIAAEMLMPEKWVKQFAQDRLSVEDMAQMFFVSQQAVALRIDSLGIDIL